jgi:hypothetical protein
MYFFFHQKVKKKQYRHLATIADLKITYNVLEFYDTHPHPFLPKINPGNALIMVTDSFYVHACKFLHKKNREFG